MDLFHLHSLGIEIYSEALNLFFFSPWVEPQTY